MFKTILITFSATVSAITLAASLFFNSILGMFGLAATSIEALSQLQAYQRVVDTIKHRHARKKTRVTKRLVKRSGKRVAATALAAATIGTAAVAIAMTSIEIADYRDEKKDLQEEANILDDTNIEFNFEQCIEESKDDAKAILSQAKTTVSSRVSNAFESTERYSKELWASVKAATNNAIDYTDSAFTHVWNSAISWFTDR